MKDGKLSKTRHAVDGGVIHINTQGHKLVNKYDKVVNKYDKPRHTKVYVGDDKYIQLKNRIPEYSVNFARRNTLFTYNERSQEITPLCKSSAFGDCDTFELNNNSLVTFHTGDPFARSGKQYVTLWNIRFMKHHIWKFPNYPHETTKLTRDYLFFLGECGKINYFSIYDSERVYELGVHAHGRVHPSSNGIWVFYSGYCDGGKLNFINHHGLDRNKGYVERFRYIWKY